MKKGNIYIIQWIDTFHFPSGWHDVYDIKEKTKKYKDYICTIGFYIGLFGKFQVFAQEMNKSEDMKNWAGIIWIPKGCITKITKLR